MPTNKTPTTNNLPFYEIFDALRKSQEFSLGIEDYFDFLKALQGTWGVDEKGVFDKEKGTFDKTKIWLLCKLLWLKPNQSYVLFERYFEEHYPLLSSSPKENQPTDKSDKNTKNDHRSTANENKNDSVQSPTENETTPNNTPTSPQQNPQKTRLNVRLNEEAGKNNSGEDNETKENIPFRRFLLSDDYLPLQKRELQQLWRNIPQKRKGGSTPTVDIKTMVMETANKGFMPEIRYEPDHEIVNHVLLLSDHGGSMVAFESLSDLLAESLQAVFPIPTRKKNKVSQYYFYNVPQEYVYKTKAHTDFVKIDDLLQKHQYQRIAIVIISDAGAARGGNSSGRVRANIRSLFQLQKITHKIVWLNPMPRKRWQGTSAARIANFVQMYECIPREIRQATLFLRGKTIITEN